MKTAFAVWNQRIAPVFDVAQAVHLVESEANQIIRESLESLPQGLPFESAIHLSHVGVDTLVCGAISRPLHEMVVSLGIKVVPFVAGNLREIIQVWLQGNLKIENFGMPGCCRRRKSLYNRDSLEEQEVYSMRGQGRAGQGGGQGRGGQGKTRTTGVIGQCVCPQCGQKETHEQGIPCTEKKCPQCGATMTRI